MLKGLLTKVKVVKHKTHRYFLFLHDAMCNEMLSKTTSSRRSGIIHARQLGIVHKMLWSKLKTSVALTFSKDKSGFRYFYKFPLIISISPSNLSSRNGQPVFFLNFLYFFYFLVASNIFLNFQASFLYFCPEIGGID